MKYLNNYLNTNPYFQEMIEQKILELNENSFKILQETGLKEFKSLYFEIVEDSVKIVLTHRSGENTDFVLAHPNIESIVLDFDEIEAYFGQDVSFLKEDYPKGLDYNFLLSKEPLLVKQVIILDFLNNHLSIDQIPEILLKNN